MFLPTYLSPSSLLELSTYLPVQHSLTQAYSDPLIWSTLAPNRLLRYSVLAATWHQWTHAGGEGRKRGRTVRLDWKTKIYDRVRDSTGGSMSESFISKTYLPSFSMNVVWFALESVQACHILRAPRCLVYKSNIWRETRERRQKEGLSIWLDWWWNRADKDDLSTYPPTHLVLAHCMNFTIQGPKASIDHKA